MSKADEMFEKLGYINVIENSDYCIAYKNNVDEIIVFFKKDNCVKKCFEQSKNQNYEQADSIKMQELQAINEKVEELGWNEQSR